MQDSSEDITLSYNPHTDDRLPVLLPLKGGGSVALGLENPGTHQPTLYIEIMSANASGVNEHHKGRVAFHTEGNKYQVRNSGDIVSFDEPRDDDVFLKTLARFTVNDIDTSRMMEITPEQDFVLRQFGLLYEKPNKEVKYMPIQSMALLIMLRDLYQQKMGKSVIFLRWSSGGSERPCPKGCGLENEGFLESIMSIANESVSDQAQSVTEEMVITWIKRFLNEYPSVLRFDTIRGHVGEHCAVLDNFVNNDAEYRYGKESVNYDARAVQDAKSQINNNNISDLLRSQILASMRKSQ